MATDPSSPGNPDPFDPPSMGMVDAVGTVIHRTLCRLLGHETGRGLLPFCIWCLSNVPQDSEK